MIQEVGIKRNSFFNLRKAKSRISALGEGDLHPDQVQLIAQDLGVTEQDVVDMNRRLGGDVSLNAPIGRDNDSAEWQDWLVDDGNSPANRLAEDEEADSRHKALVGALRALNKRELRIFEARRLSDEPITLDALAEEFATSRERVRQIEVRGFAKVQKAVKIANDPKLPKRHPRPMPRSLELAWPRAPQATNMLDNLRPAGWLDLAHEERGERTTLKKLSLHVRHQRRLRPYNQASEARKRCGQATARALKGSHPRNISPRSDPGPASTSPMNFQDFAAPHKRRLQFPRQRLLS